MSAFDYAPAPESASIVRLRDRYGLFIDGRFVDAQDGVAVATIKRCMRTSEFAGKW